MLHLLLYLFIIQVYSCPNNCNYRGICTNGSTGICDCYPGFHGVDCSIRLCPAGIAWFDYPSSDRIAHSDYTECSNMGKCDRSTGKCICRDGFTGPACGQMLCPLGDYPINDKYYGNNYRLPCSGNGKCLSLREATILQDYVNFYNITEYNGWDADMIYGCVCDNGWEGFDCSKRSCPYGDDPITYGLDEIQLIDCKCTYCTGGIYINYKNQITDYIPIGSSATFLQYQLLQLTSIEKVTVTPLLGSTICSGSGSVTEVVFQIPQGNQPAMTITTANGLETSTLVVQTSGSSSSLLSTAASVTGTKEYVSCSNRGICLNNTGICNCYDTFESSNGLGQPGDRGDCGYHRVDYQLYRQTNITIVNTTCPFLLNAVCSGHGSCNDLTSVCTCDEGYTGSACSNLTCPQSRRWFGDIGYNHSIYEVCGGVGECDGNTGECFNCGGNWAYYNGSACEYLSCPQDDDGNYCSGNGVCLSMTELGLLRYNWQKNYAPVYYNSTWDAESIHGCWCERAISIDNQYSTNYLPDPQIFGYIDINITTHFDNVTIISNNYDSRFYRGPYAYSATDFKGFDCSYAGCPTGDNPVTIQQVNEVQSLEFVWGSGHFTLTFRENTTYPIYCNQTDEVLKYRLEELYTINTVSLTRIGNESLRVCSNESVLLIEFVTEFGDLPLLTADVTHMQPASYSIANPIVITEYRKGTKEDIECSGQGICIESTGRCNCVSNYMSSNGYVDSSGERGDCTFRNPLYYTSNYKQ